MIRKLTTFAVVALAIAGMAMLNMYMNPQKTTAAQEEAAEEAAEKLAEAKEAAAEASSEDKAKEETPAPSSGDADKDSEEWPDKTPDSFRVAFDTTMGTFVVECNRAWAPRGVDRFFELAKSGYYEGNRFFRVVKGFVVQFGIHGDPAVSAKWRNKTIKDDPVMQSNTEGYVTFAKGGPNSRTTQIFINLKNNANLDKMDFPPFGKVVKGMDVVKSLNGQYGDTPSQAQAQIHRYGNEFLDQRFPGLDYVKRVRFVE